jgi:hypothetical protein
MAKQQSSKLNISEFWLKSLKSKEEVTHIFEWAMDLHWENFLFVSVLRFRLVVSEHKHVSTDRMSMHITIEKYISGLKCPLHHELCVVVYWVKLARTSNPLSVKICAH